LSNGTFRFSWPRSAAALSVPRRMPCQAFRAAGRPRGLVVQLVPTNVVGPTAWLELIPAGVPQQPRQDSISEE
jgi:hypothetical protein